MKKYKVSYLIALYNKERYIVDCIESILADRSDFCDIEICIVDDGSTDNSYEIVCQHYSSNPIVIIDRLLVNKGKVAAYNKCFELSSGDFLSVFGADDLLMLGRTDFLLKECLLKVKSTYGGYVRYVDGVDGMYIKPPNSLALNKVLLGNILSGGCSMIYREHVNDIFPIPPNLKFEDWWISFHLIRNNCVHTIDRPVTRYRLHDSNDNGSLLITEKSLIKDYSRHLDFLYIFKKYLVDKNDLRILNRSIDIRVAVLTNQGAKSIFSPPFDKSWIKLILIKVFGIRAYIFLLNKIIG